MARLVQAIWNRSVLDRMDRTCRAMTVRSGHQHEPVIMGRRLRGTATRHFAPGHPAALGHFPGNPIIPGAVLLREIVAAIVSTDNAPVARATAWRKILWAKFHQSVRPGDSLVIGWEAAGEEVRFSCVIASSDRPAVTGALRLPPP